MKIRYRLWYAFIAFFHLLSWYYVLCFCSVYINSSYGWLYGSLISVALDIIIFQIIMHVILALTRVICQKYKESKIAQKVYKLINKVVELIG